MKPVPYNKITVELKKQIIDLYYSEKKLNFKEMAQILNVSERAFSRVLKENNINTRLKGKYTIKNENYFNIIDSEFKAYILGFIYADGYVGEHNNFTLALSDKVDDNLCLLTRLKDEIGISKPVRHVIQGNYGSYCLNFSSRQIVSDLNKLGVFPKKSLMMENLPNIDEKYMSHFIRGLFDGDGSIYTYFDKYDNRMRTGFEILGTYMFLDKIQDILVEKCNIKKTNLHQSHPELLYRISYKGIKSLISIREYLYKDATVYIHYKYNKFYNI